MAIKLQKNFVLAMGMAALVFIFLAACRPTRAPKKQDSRTYMDFSYEYWKNAQGLSVAITAYTGPKGADIEIPPSIDGISVTAIGRLVFNGSQLQSLTLPNSVTTIEDWAFAFNQLQSVTIPNSLATIGNWAFAGNQLQSLTLPDSVTTIEDWAFAFNQLQSITIPKSVRGIGASAFTGNPLTSITILADLYILDSEWPGNFHTAYSNAGQKPGTYTRADVNTLAWTRR
jgi:hypothetical protein